MPERYRGIAFVHWTMAMQDRATGWLTQEWFVVFRERLERDALKYRVVVPAAVAMPDHLHLLVAGVVAESDQRLFVRALRRFINASLPVGIRLQKQAHDHVLRTRETGGDAFASLVSYIAENPVRKGLVKRSVDWPFTVACVPELEGLHPAAEEFGDLWWTWWNKRVADSC